jgi:hypothetical protein
MKLTGGGGGAHDASAVRARAEQVKISTIQHKTTEIRCGLIGEARAD